MPRVKTYSYNPECGRVEVAWKTDYVWDDDEGDEERFAQGNRERCDPIDRLISQVWWSPEPGREEC